MIRFSTRLLPLIAILGLDVAPASASAVPDTMIGSPNPVPGLVGDRDTVKGVDSPYWDHNQEWKRANFIRVRNRHAHTLVVDSIRFPSDSITQGSWTRPFDRLFAVRTYAGGTLTTPVWTGSLKQNPITLAVGDSADFGLFELGIIKFLVKQTAAARRYRIGDTLTAPVTLYAGTDSLRFILKAKLADAAAGTALAPMPGRGADGKETGTLPVTADGRRIPGQGVSKGMEFRAPEPGTASRPR